MLSGLNMNYQLTINSIMEHAQSVNAHREIVSVIANEGIVRMTFGEMFTRSAKLANALRKLGVNDGDRIGTLMWNDHRHMEAYYGISCSGLVCHTINPRLFPEQVDFIINDADDQVLIVDALVFPLVEALAPKLVGVKTIIVAAKADAMPETSLENVVCYETLIEGESDSYDWPALNENDACSLCYTSGTTGNPKGVLYSHRAMVLMCFAISMPNAVSLSCADTVLPIVPMFHVNAWGMTYAAAMVGANLVMPGPKMADGETLHHLITTEKVTIGLGVPTIWQGLIEHANKNNLDLAPMDRVVVGGSATPKPLYQQFTARGIDMMIGWGMTELSPIGSLNTKIPEFDQLSEDELADERLKAGRQIYGVEMRIVDDAGEVQPHDGKSPGQLQVRGPWVVGEYFKGRGADSFTKDGWFDTGDVSVIDQNGFMAITDRTKDLIKSGGEWISSIELEGIAVTCEGVSMVAAIAAQHPKWDERPLLIAVKEEGANVSEADVLATFEGKVAKWMIPNSVVFTDELPLTATGKIHKLKLREKFGEHYMQGETVTEA